jgi:hypothetical protein
VQKFEPQLPGSYTGTNESEQCLQRNRQVDSVGYLFNSQVLKPFKSFSLTRPRDVEIEINSSDFLLTLLCVHDFLSSFSINKRSISFVWVAVFNGVVALVNLASVEV